ncbi:hypothetical protein J437_LFUL017648 [Ladona fulva]|uniref:Metalloprotease TIKI homolog n=1 Tax=Ladona fulva TaxID=123851 RepID=A0A8K0KNQ4_LADFU|nr:hypothetical protein J437_LFUL017648 [Ladona fulva]
MKYLFNFSFYRLQLLICWAPLDAKGFTAPDYCDGIKSEKPLSFLWGVRRHPPSYFFGTIHVPYTRVWDFIPENAKQAFQESDNVFFELDLLNRKTFEAIHRCQLMPRGQKLSDILPAKLFLRLKRHLEYVQRMIPRWVTSGQYLSTTITGNWRRKRPFWVMLMVKSLNEVDIKWHGIPVLDLYLAQKASSMKKDTGGVEDVEEQCVPVNGISLSQVLTS